MPPARFSLPVFVLFSAACLAINYPGRLTVDGLVQLIGAIDRRYLTDWHSPLVTWLWSLPGGLLGQPFGAVLVQALPLSFYAAVRPSGPSAWTIKAVAALALVAVFKLALVVWAGIIIKDALLLGLVLAAVAAFQLSCAKGAGRLWPILFVCCVVIVGFIRPTNFVLLAIPALTLAFFYVRRGRRLWIAIALCAAGPLLLLPAGMTVNRWVFHAYPTHPEQQLILFDLAAVSARTGTNVFRGAEGWPVDRLPPPKACYTAAEWDPLSPWGRCAGYSQAYAEAVGRSGTAPLVRHWGTSLVRHHAAYRRHRVEHLIGSFGRSVDIVGEENPPPFDKKTLALNSSERDAEFRAVIAGRVPPDTFQKAHRSAHLRPFVGVSRLVLGQKGIGLLALAVCICLLARQGWLRFRGFATNPVVILATAIGLANVLMVGLFGVAAAARYLLPLIACAFVAAIAVLQQDRRAGERASA
ncbi:MAG TPA: hypothetical protein VIA98_08085 [Allosphingosinicella sp.]|jgi:hypothetical protein